MELVSSEYITQGKWNNNNSQTINVSACLEQKHQGFICESNDIKAWGIYLDTEQSICHFELHPGETPETVFEHTRKGCICIRNLCNSIFVDNVLVDTIQSTTQIILFVMIPKLWAVLLMIQPL